MNRPPGVIRLRNRPVPPEEVFTQRLLSEVYEQPVEVFPHPRTGAVLVLPERT